VSALEAATSSQIQITGISSVGPAVTGITTESTLQFIAIGIGMLALFLLYLTGTPQVVASILIALVCDTTITVGAICFFNVSLSLPIVSALLTVAGYSVYDSVVVARHLQKEIPLRSDGGTGWEAGFSNCLRYLSRRLILTMTTTALAGLATAIYCEGLLRDFGIVMATGAIFGMMSTVAIVVGVMRFHYRRQEHEALMNPPAVSSS
jgi:preprotein translocase subunit SecF